MALTAWQGLALRAFRTMPSHWRETIKGMVGALGHEPGWAHRMRADALAAGPKRLDNRAPQIRDILSMAGIARLDGAHVLEFGTGHLLSEAMLYHLLGAETVVASDYFPILQRDRLASVWDGIEEAEMLAALGAVNDAVSRGRLRRLRDASRSLDALAELGIHYIAPYDAAAGPLPGERFDLITSTSVLEHVPADAASAILDGLYAMLQPAGAMVHGIHLEDHRDFEYPHAFLAADTDWTPDKADARGNRLRANDWETLFGKLPGAEILVSIRHDRNKALPAELDPAFTGYAEVDLRAAGLNIAVRRRAEAT